MTMISNQALAALVTESEAGLTSSELAQIVLKVDNVSHYPPALMTRLRARMGIRVIILGSAKDLHPDWTGTRNAQVYQIKYTTSKEIGRRESAEEIVLMASRLKGLGAIQIRKKAKAHIDKYGL